MKPSRTKIIISFIVCIMAEGSAFAGIKEKLLEFAIRSSISNQVSTAQPTLDSESESCLGCHNGGHASQIIIKNAEAPLQIWNGQTNNHPVGMIYDQYQTRSPDDFTPRQMLNPNIVLVDGRVGCRSCHAMKASDIYEPDIMAQPMQFANPADCPSSDQLTVTVSGSALCLSCHNK